MYQTTDRRSDLNLKQDDMLASRRFVIERKPDTVYFYELEEAVVLDVILNEDHPEVQSSTISPELWPPNIDGSEPSPTEKNYGLLGCVRFRFLHSQPNQEKETLGWAFPIEKTGVVEYPLMNEIVIVGKYLGKYFYSKKLNTNAVTNSTAHFIAERVVGKVDKNINTYSADGEYTGPVSKMTVAGGPNYEGVLGDYFKFNSKIRSLKHFEGDTILESRFGSSIRFGAYDANDANDSGLGEYSNGGGNPMVLIRNRQAPIEGDVGKTGKGYTTEDVNKDGTSIHITSGKTISEFNPVVENSIISGDSVVSLPSLKGDQIVINSDRLVLSSKANEMLFFSKKKIGMTTDSEVCISCAEKMTLTSLKTATINAQQIFLGDHAKIYEPALLGRTTITWMERMADLLLANVNSQILILQALITFATAHQHIGNMGRPTAPFPPSSLAQVTIWTTQLQALQACQISIIAWKSQLSTWMSSRVFVSGGDD